MAKMSILFDGFEDLAARVDEVGGLEYLHKAVDEALTETATIIKDNLISAAAVYDSKGKKGYAQGDMYRSIIQDADVTWEGTIGTVNSGFDLDAKGGFHSIFVMYGTAMYGTPRIRKDQKLYDAIKGTKTKKDIAEKQEEIMQKYINLEGGKK